MDKIIVDSSVWIDFFANALPEATTKTVDQLVLNNIACVTDIILYEMLVGTLSENEYKKTNLLFSSLLHLKIQDTEEYEFNHFSWSLHRTGLPGKYTDASIAFLAQKYDCPVLSFDTYFAKLAKKKIIRILQF